MDFLVSNWYIILILVAAIGVGGYSAYVFAKRPTTEQLTKVKEWLLYAVTQAEKELGSGTGQIKLRYVYDMFIVRFPWLAKTIAFDAFSIMVNEVLEKFKGLLNDNKSLQGYVKDGD